MRLGLRWREETRVPKLGYAVRPDLLYEHEGMVLLSPSYLEEMSRTIDTLAALEPQEFDRVTIDHQSALLRSILSRDISLVFHLLSSFPD